MTWLELWEFVEALPYDSMTRSALAGDRTRRRWTEAEYMQAHGLTLMQHMIQVMWAAHLEGKPPKVIPWSLPDLRSPEQVAKDEDRKQARRRRYFEATRPGAVMDPEYARRLAEAREEHLRLEALRLAALRPRAQSAEEPTTE
ncbi:hypothetical protein [Streptomyces ossamyceticus]|uniref:Uncharacterized protein n=1 Tax=Streptomyces ossamyceticus TaxID=249581 RepID=A0ABV2V4W4_9ACTN